MSLLSIPPELRLKIYEFLPDLQWGREESLTACSALTPSIAQTCRTLRRETLPVLTANTLFTLQIDDAGRSWSNRLPCWLDGLGSCISRVRILQISRHWAIPLPMRHQGHVGFYLRIERRSRALSSVQPSSNISHSTDGFPPEWSDRFVTPVPEGIWEVTAGTYPVARDMRGMRWESIELLAKIVRHHVHVIKSGLLRRDVEFLFRVMDIVASHPISTYDFEQADFAHRRRHEMWAKMEQQLRAIDAPVMPPAGSEEHHGRNLTGGRFFTPC